MSTESRIKVNFSTGEFEVAGTEAFIEQKLNWLEQFIPDLQQAVHSHQLTAGAPIQNVVTSEDIPSTENQSIKSFLGQLPEDTRQGDYLLAAAFYLADNSHDDTFGTREASAVLKSINIEVTNPSQYIKNNINSGRLLEVGKRRFQFTDKGKKHIQKILRM